MRWYQNKPFCVWKEVVDPKRVAGMAVVGESKRMPWFVENQLMYPFPEKVERISLEFERLCSG